MMPLLIKIISYATSKKASLFCNPSKMVIHPLLKKEHVRFVERHLKEKQSAWIRSPMSTKQKEQRPSSTGGGTARPAVTDVSQFTVTYEGTGECRDVPIRREWDLVLRCQKSCVMRSRVAH